MKTWLPFWILLIVVGCGKQPGSDIRTGTLQVLATEAYLPLIQQEAVEYHRIYAGAAVQVLGMTTRDAIVQMINDSAACIVVDRPLNAEEHAAVQQAGMRVVETEIASDAVAIVVHLSNRTRSLSAETLGAIVAGSVTDWRTVPNSRLSGPIELCLTGRNSGLFELLTRHFFKPGKDVVPSFVAPSQSDVIAYVALHPFAIGVVPFAVWEDTIQARGRWFKKDVRVLDVRAKEEDGGEAVKLSQNNIYDRVYPLVYSLYIYTSEKSPGVAQGFSTFVASMPGQKVFWDAGLVPKTVPYRVIQLTQE
jgi:phosphate transport system substrate-binding protein